MTRFFVIGLSVFALSVSAAAQQMGQRQAPNRPARNAVRPPQQRSAVPAGPTNKEQAVANARMVLSMLQLDAQQMAAGEGLVEEYAANLDAPVDLERLSYLAGELNKERGKPEAERDEAKIKELESQLRNTSPVQSAWRTFIDNVTGLLNEKQQERLKKVDAQMASGGGLGARPVDIYRVAQEELGLTAEQKKQVDAIHSDFRKNKIRDYGDIYSLAESGMEVDFANAILAVLTDAQKQTFMEKIGWMMPKLTEGPKKAEKPEAEAAAPAAE